jgi:hypothetical protein
LAEAGASSFSVPLDESFADENKDAGGQRYNVEQENGWPDIRVAAVLISTSYLLKTLAISATTSVCIRRSMFGVERSAFAAVLISTSYLLKALAISATTSPSEFDVGCSALDVRRLLMLLTSHFRPLYRLARSIRIFPLLVPCPSLKSLATHPSYL